MSLAAQLANLPPRESDTLLSGVWKAFAATEFREALDILLGDVQREVMPALTAPGTSDSARAHAAGALYALSRIQSTINACIAFDPAQAKYAEPSVEADTPVNPDPFTIV